MEVDRWYTTTGERADVVNLTAGTDVSVALDGVEFVEAALPRHRAQRRGAELRDQRARDSGTGGAVRPVVRLLIECRTASTHPMATHTEKMNHWMA
jgi:hypothetical protein